MKKVRENMNFYKQNTVDFKYEISFYLSCMVFEIFEFKN